MTFVDNLKDIARKKTEKKFQDEEYVVDDDIADQIRRDPQYDKVIAKLRELRLERDVLVRRLEKVELDIDTCLVLISINEERSRLAKEENGVR